MFGVFLANEHPWSSGALLVRDRMPVYRPGMSRIPIATFAILVFVILWIAAAAVLGDYVRPLHWAVQAIYYPIAGFAWVGPVRWLMLWGAHRRM